MASDPLDIRILTSITTHPKWLRLHTRLGNDGRIGLVHLWLWARQHRPSGDLSGFTVQEIEAGAGWAGEPGALFKALLEIAWIDQLNGSTRLHGWEDSQRWAINQERRSAIARANAEKRWDRMRGVPPEPRNTPRDAIGTPNGSPNRNPDSNAPLPSPPLRRREGGGEDAPPTEPHASRSAGVAQNKIKTCQACKSRPPTGTLDGRELCYPCTRKALFGDTATPEPTPA